MSMLKLVFLGMSAWFTVGVVMGAAESTADSGAVLPVDEVGFDPLFNGKDLVGWKSDTQRWMVQDGMLIGRSEGAKHYDFLTTTRTFEDFVLRFQIQLVDGKGNTGVLYRSKPVPNSDEVSGYQADFAPARYGNLFDEARRRKVLASPDPKVLAKAVKPTGWNDYEVRAEGNRITHSINGIKVLEYAELDASIPRRGVIALQIHKGGPMEVHFRDLRIKELPPVKKPVDDLKSQVVHLGEVRPRVSDWGELRLCFSGQTFATKDVFVASVLVQPGKSNHKSHRHAEEEYMVLIDGTGTWSLGGNDVLAQRGDVVYAEPWGYHGFTNTGDTPATYVVFRYRGKSVPPPAQPDNRPNELTHEVGRSAE